MYSFGLAKPPDLLVNKNTDKVNEPEERSKEEEDYRNNDTNGVLCIKALNKSVNCPNDVESRNTENELYDKGKFVKDFDNVFHYKMPPKIILAYAINCRPDEARGAVRQI